MGNGSWYMPEDRPVVERSAPNPRRVSDGHIQAQLGDVEEWLKGDDKTIPAMTCLLLEEVVHGLIHGGRYLYGWANGAGGDAPKGQGMPELEVLQECNIDCSVLRTQPRSKGQDVTVTLKGVPAPLYLGFDDDGLTRQPRTIGPRQSGGPPDIVLQVGPNWVLELSERQREMSLFNALLCVIPHETRYLNRWQVISPDIVMNSATIEIYGDESNAAKLVLHAASKHVQTYLPGLTDAQQDAMLERLLRQRGATLYREADGAILNPDGTIAKYATE